jgi:hypothetical protein
VKVRAFRSTGSIGGYARLRVSTPAFSLYRWFNVDVVANGRVVAAINAPVRVQGSIQQIKWHVPRTMHPRTLRFRVVGYNNKIKSAEASASLVIKRTT